MFRLAVAVLAVIGLVSLLAGASSAAVGIGWLLLAPFVILFKVVFFFMLFGAIAHFVSQRSGGPGSRPWDRRWDRRSKSAWNRPSPWARCHGRTWADRDEARDMSADDRPADEERFEEWHRMQHARREVDSWVEIPEELDPRENR
jgi:hypothetical protein